MAILFHPLSFERQTVIANCAVTATMTAPFVFLTTVKIDICHFLINLRSTDEFELTAL